MNKVIDFYLITLPNRRQVSEANSAIIKRHLGNPIIIDGYNPLDISSLDFEKYNSLFLNRYGINAINNQLACLRAHRGAMYRFLETENDFCVIGEDDFDIKNIKNIQEALDQYDPLKDEVIHFGGFQGLPSENIRMIDRNGYIVDSSLRFAHMAALYCINRSFANKYIDLAEKKGINNDDWATLKAHEIFKKIRLVPSILHGHHDSILDPGGERGYKSSKLRMKINIHNIFHFHLAKPKLFSD